MPQHPNSLKNLKPFKPGENGNRNKKRIVVDKFHNWLGDLPDGVYPWELIQDAITDKECPINEKIKGAAIIGNWVLKDDSVNIDVNAETVVIDGVEERIKELLKTQDEVDTEAVEDANNYEENE